MSFSYYAVSWESVRLFIFFTLFLLMYFSHSLMSISGIAQAVLCSAVFQITHGTKPHYIPFHLGGLGLRSSYHSASAAFLGSCYSIHLLTSQLLSQDFHDVTFLDKGQAVALFEEQSSATFIPGATKCNLQAMIDNRHYNKLLASAIKLVSRHFFICLKLVVVGSRPYLSLFFGLAIHGPEFVVGLCLWLEVPLFPVSPN